MSRSGVSGTGRSTGTRRSLPAAPGCADVGPPRCVSPGRTGSSSRSAAEATASPGYSVCDGGMVIDLSLMKGIRVDPDGRTARVQAGVLLGELDRATQAFGLAVPAGIVTHTGVAGLTLGGGIGWIMRKYGLTIDNLLSVDIVTADGEFADGQRDGERRPLLGGARRRRQLRHRDRVRVPATPAGARGLRGTDLLADGGGAEGAPLLPRLDRRLPGRADDDRRAAASSGAPGRARRTWSASMSSPSTACYAGPVEDGARAAASAQVVRPAVARPVRAQAVPGSSVDVRSRLPAWLVVLRPVLRRRRAQRRRDRHRRRTRPCGSSRRSPALPCGRWVERSPGSARTRPPSTDAAPASRSTSTATARPRTASTPNASGRAAYWSALAPYHTSVYVNFLMDEGEDAHPAGVRAGEVRPAEGAQAQVRPGELLPAQPEHQPRLGRLSLGRGPRFTGSSRVVGHC